MVEWNIMKMCGHEEATSGNARSDTSSLSTTKSLHWRTKQVLRGDTNVITDIQNSVGCLAVSVASREVRSTSVWRASLMSQCTCKKENISKQNRQSHTRERTEETTMYFTICSEICSRKKKNPVSLQHFPQSGEQAKHFSKQTCVCNTGSKKLEVPNIFGSGTDLFQKGDHQKRIGTEWTKYHHSTQGYTCSKLS